MRTKQTNSTKRFRFWARASVGFLSLLVLAAAPSQALGLPSTDFIDQSLGVSTPLGSADASVQNGAAHACADLAAPSLPALPVALPVAIPDVSSAVDLSVSTCVDADANSAISDATSLAEETANGAVDQADGILDRVLDQVRSALGGIFGLF